MLDVAPRGAKGRLCQRSQFGAMNERWSGIKHKSCWAVDMTDLLSVGGMRRLNIHNCGYWKTCIESYLMGTKTTPSMKENVEALREWRINVDKAIFVLKTMIEEDLVEHIRDMQINQIRHERKLRSYSRRRMRCSCNSCRKSLHVSHKTH